MKMTDVSKENKDDPSWKSSRKIEIIVILYNCYSFYLNLELIKKKPILYYYYYTVGCFNVFL